MEKRELVRQKAHEYYKYAQSAEHVAFNVVKNPKLMLPMIENLFLSMSYATSAILLELRRNDAIPEYGDTFEEKCDAFKKVLRPLHIDRKFLDATKELREIIIAHQKSPIEFTKGNSVVICSDSYSMKVIAPNTIREYMGRARGLLEYMEKIIHERIFV